MKILINWIDDKKKSTYVLTGLLILFYVAFLCFPESHWIAIPSIVASIIFPFAIFLVWIIDSVFVATLLSRRWTAILFAGVVVVYGMFANTFSSDVINNHFGVDPAHFTVTNIFLTTIYLLVGVFKPLVMFPIWVVVILFGAIPLFALLLVSREQIKLRLFQYLIAVILFSISFHSLNLLNQKLPVLAEQVALHADFNEKHRCTASWSVNVDKVVFLHDGNVLAHISGTQNYKVLPCNPR